MKPNNFFIVVVIFSIFFSFDIAKSIKLDYLENSPSLQPIPDNVNLGESREKNYILNENLQNSKPDNSVATKSEEGVSLINKNNSLIFALILIIIVTGIFVVFNLNAKIKQE